MERLFRNIYPAWVKVLFLIFIFGVFSFGRAFSIINIKLYFPIFITEILLLIVLPLVILNFNEILKLPRLFLSACFIYFLFGVFYLFSGFCEKNIFAIRDFVVLISYMVFFPLSFICFNSVRYIKIFVLVILAANIVSILTGNMLISGITRFWLYDFISKEKTFQVGMIYGLSFSFLLIFYSYFRSKFLRLFILCLAAVNLYMLAIFAVRSLWVAAICLMIFLVLISDARDMLKIYLRLFATFVVIGSILCYVNFVIFKFPQLNVLIGKSRGLACFLVKSSGKLSSGVDPDHTKLSLRAHENSVSFSREATKPKISFSAEGNETSFDQESLVATRDKLEKMGYDNIVWRGKIWKQTIDFIAGSYFFGKGFGHYPKYDIWGDTEIRSPFLDSNIIPTHNYLLTIFYKMGAVGLLLFLFINFYVFYYGLKYVKRCKDMFLSLVIRSSLCSLFFWHIMALFFDIIDSPPTSILLWIFIGLIFAAINIGKNREREKFNLYFKL